MQLIERPQCVFCSSGNHIKTQVVHHAKDGIDTWNATVLECLECGSQWSTPVPSAVDFERLYQHDYKGQASGLVRWHLRYGDRHFDSSRVVLEVGAGTVGIKSECDGRYHSWELGHGATFDGMFDAATEEQLERAVSLGVTDIVSIDCYEHVLNPRQFIINCARILTLGGMLYVVHGELKGKDETQRRRGLRQAPHINCPIGEGMASVLDGLFVVVKGTAGTCAEDRDPAWIMRRI